MWQIYYNNLIFKDIAMHRPTWQKLDELEFSIGMKSSGRGTSVQGKIQCFYKADGGDDDVRLYLLIPDLVIITAQDFDMGTGILKNDFYLSHLEKFHE